MRKSNSLKQIYLTSVALAEDSQKFAEEMAKYNPELENNNRLFLIILAGMAGKLAWKFARLNSELTEIHEERQLNETNSNS